MTNITTVELPTGIKAVRICEDQMIGDMLEVETDTGILIRINCLHLANHEGGVSVFTNKDEMNDGGSFINFDSSIPNEIGHF